MTIPKIRTAHFNRKGFSKFELQRWSTRTGAQIIRVSYSASKAKVVYK